MDRLSLRSFANLFLVDILMLHGIISIVGQQQESMQGLNAHVSCCSATDYAGIRYNIEQVVRLLNVKVKAKADIALPGGTPPQSYGTSLTIWDHTVLPATRHK